MKHSTKLCTIILLGILGLTYLSGCTSLDQCSNDLLAEYTNPSKTYKIVKFDRGCGATTANSIQISIIPVGEDLENTAGNIFIANSISRGNLKDDTSVVVSWLNDFTIKVKYDNRLKIFTKENKYGKLNIVYELTWALR